MNAPTPSQAQQAISAADLAQRPKATLVSAKAAGDVVVVQLVTADGTHQTVHATTADSPALAVLPESDRSAIRSAFLTLARRAAPDAAP